MLIDVCEKDGSPGVRTESLRRDTIDSFELGDKPNTDGLREIKLLQSIIDHLIIVSKNFGK